MTETFIRPVELEKSWRLINHGPTVLVSGRHYVAGGQFYATGESLNVLEKEG